MPIRAALLVLTCLAALQGGTARAAMLIEASEEGRPVRLVIDRGQDRVPLQDLLRADPDVLAQIGEDALASLFGLDHHVKQVDHIFERVFGDDAAR